MKRVIVQILSFCLLCGCSRTDRNLERIMLLREKIISSSECNYNVVVTADYSDRVFSFEMQCIMNREGVMTFQVTQPLTISGLTGNISYEKGAITFDDQILAFETLAK